MKLDSIRTSMDGEEDKEDADRNQMQDDESRFERRRNLAGFWILGLCNNFAYVVMLTAATDILRTQDNVTATSNTSISNHCNPIGTGAILLADILPGLIAKLTAPFYIQGFLYSVKVTLITVFAAGSFPIVATSTAVFISIIGVVFTSLSSGFGEVTFLGLLSHFHKNSVSAWSSGTGAAGVTGALSYAGLIAIGVTPRTALLLMIPVPVAMSLVYFFLLAKPTSVTDAKCTTCQQKGQDPENDELITRQDEQRLKLPLLERLKFIKSLLKYIIPLLLVYFAEYFINQALFELIYFENIWLPVEQQYRWYQVIYQIGVFISRSSVTLVQIKKIWIMAVLQWINVGIFLLQVFYGFIPSIWIVFALILFEGLLGGSAYVNTFFRIRTEVSEEYCEFSMGTVSNADAVGIALAGAVAVPVHNLICAR